MKNRKLNFCLMSLLIVIVLGLVFIITGENNLFASNIDYIIQHSVFPDYLRNLFYETGDLFPDFMPHLGAGQNIYNISYYGLYNPVILLSYLFPFVSMINYLIAVSILSVIVSAILLYKFFLKHNFSEISSFVGAVLFITASPILFHSHRHLMFINYMPFLIIGLYGVDNYIKNKSCGLLIFSLVMIVYSSFYFSIGAFVSLFVYLVYRYYDSNKFDLKVNILYFLKASVPFFVSILVGALVLIPTFEVILLGRDGSGSNVNLIDLFIPSNGLLYDSYSMGLSVFTLIALVYALFKFNFKDKMLSLFILFISFIPVFSFILNGFLYVDYKALIPFIPLGIFITVKFLEDVFKFKILKIIFCILIIVSSLVISVSVNKKDSFVDKENYVKNTESLEKINEFLKDYDDSYYKVNYLFNNEKFVNVSGGMYRSTLYSSTQNLDYKNFYYKTLENNNPYRNEFMISSSSSLLSQIYLGEKYIVSENTLSNNYKLVNTIDGLNIYENINVLSLGYVSNNYISENDYSNLEVHDKSINLLGNVISDKSSNVDLKYLEEVSYEIISTNNAEITEDNGCYNVLANSGNNIEISVDSDSYVFITFEVEPKNKDFSISVNDSVNKLTNKNWKYYNHNETFSYVTNANENLDFEFSKGNYLISDFKIYEIPDEYLISDVTDFNVDMNKTKGDYIYGDVNVLEDGMFVLNIPFDENFIIEVDGKKVDYGLVNESFIGFDIDKGNHNIKIEYKNNLKDISLYISLSTIISLVIIKIIKRRSS